MRIPTMQLFQNSLTAMQKQQAELQYTQLQLSTGLRVLKPSDDPVAAVKVLNLNTNLGVVDQFGRNANVAAAALSQQARVLLMDEPTGALTPQEVEDLFRIVRRLRESGTAIVFISHRLPEVFEISDRITVLRDGRFVGTRRASETTQDEIIRMMVGRELGALYERPSTTPGVPLLRVERLSAPGLFEDISFEVPDRRFLSLLGPSGCGKSTILRMLAGLIGPTRGRVAFHGEPVAEPPPGMVYVFQQYTKSLFPWLTVLGNVEFGARSPHARRR